MKAIESVMIVEDNPIDIFINTRVIEQSGLSSYIISQQSAREALHYLKEADHKNQPLPNLILLDLRMPDMDGFEFLDQFSNLSTTIRSACKIIMLSSSLDPIDDEQARKHPDVISFISKPLTRDKLTALMNSNTVEIAN